MRDTQADMQRVRRDKVKAEQDVLDACDRGNAQMLADRIELDMLLAASE